MTADAPARRTWHAEDELPMPVLGWVGFLVSVLTMLCLLAALAARVREDGWAHLRVVFTVWSLLYGGGLVCSWWVMRPTVVTRASHALVSGGLLVQGLSYLGLWAGAAASAWTGARADQLPYADRIDLMGLSIVMAFVSLFFVGPFFGLMAVLSARRGGWMALTQLFGLIGILLVWTSD